MSSINKPNVYTGIALAVTAAFIWSGNFIVARGVSKIIPPISLAFYRWLTASVILAPLAWKKIKAERKIIAERWKYFFFVALWGIALFNTFIYVAGHYSPAINLALIGTTSAPVFAILLAAIFLKEKITLLRMIGLGVCISGIAVLLSSGSFRKLLEFRFSPGDGFILIAAFCFAVYTILVRKKPKLLSPVSFLFTIFLLGTLLLLPPWLWELHFQPSVIWNKNLLYVVGYLGIGASVISYWCWNLAIARLGAARTALFGNLIPVFSSIEAGLLLRESITFVHIISLLLVIIGLIIANIQSIRKS